MSIIDAKDLLIHPPAPSADKSKLTLPNSQIPKSESIGTIEERTRPNQSRSLPQVVSNPEISSGAEFGGVDSGATASGGISTVPVISGSVECQGDWEGVEDGEDPLAL